MHALSRVSNIDYFATFAFSSLTYTQLFADPFESRLTNIMTLCQLILQGLFPRNKSIFISNHSLVSKFGKFNMATVMIYIIVPFQFFRLSRLYHSQWFFSRIWCMIIYCIQLSFLFNLK